MISTIAFQLDSSRDFIQVMVDGRNLADVIGTDERILPCDTGHTDIAEFPTVVDPRVVSKGQREVVLFVCECRQVACGPVTVDIETTDETVRFTNFNGWPRDKLPASLTFGRRQYFHALDELAAQTKKREESI